MPIFTYVCSLPECRHRFDKLVTRSDDKVRCPICEEPAIKQFNAGYNIVVKNYDPTKYYKNKI